MSEAISMPVPPEQQVLREALERLHVSLRDFEDALAQTNDPEVRDRFLAPVAAGMKLLDMHMQRISPSLADDALILRSYVVRYLVPREDPDLGPTMALRHLRMARGNMLADVEELLQCAAAVGLKPTAPDMELPEGVTFERLGYASLVHGIARRLTAVERGLHDVERAQEANFEPDVRQIGLVNFYVSNMQTEVALMKAEIGSGNSLDFSSLGRAVEVMADLTRDFVATTQGMARVMSDRVVAASKAMAKPVRRLAGGVRSVAQWAVRRVGKTGTADTVQTAEVVTHDPPAQADDAEAKAHEAFWEAIYAGDLARNFGNLDNADTEFRTAESIAIAALDAFAEGDAWQHNLSVSYDRLGDVAMARGDLNGAEQANRDGLTIAERLAAGDPGNTEWQRDLSVSHNKLGDVAVARGDLDGAERAYRDGLTIRERLAAGDPGNAKWQRDLSVSHERLGYVAEARGDLDGAERAYRDGLTIRERLAAGDLGNAIWQRDLAVSHINLGNVARARGDWDGAERAYRDGLTIAERLAAGDPGNADWQRDLSISHNNLGDVAVARGDWDGAERAYRDGLAIRERLAAGDPGNAEWQRDLSISHERLGDLSDQRGDVAEALRCYRASLPIAERLVERWPNHPEFVSDLEITRRRIAALEAKLGEGPGR